MSVHVPDTRRRCLVNVNICNRLLLVRRIFSPTGEAAMADGCSMDITIVRNHAW
jgi:hypothetical protein